MTSYLNDIYDALEGDTPKAKYEYLQALKQRVNEQQGTINFAYINFRALGQPPSPEATLSICAAVAETLSRSIPEDQLKFLK